MVHAIIGGGCTLEHVDLEISTNICIRFDEQCLIRKEV